MIIDEIKRLVAEECNSSGNVFGPVFFDEHLSVVVGYARRLAGVVGGDLEIVELAGWLHDIAAIRDFTALPKHAALSAEIARRLLQERGYPSERIDRVAKCIASHSAPVQVGNGSNEEVCVSNADAMAQIVKPAYWFYYAYQVRQFGFAEGRDWLRQRVENHRAALIPPAWMTIEKQYRQISDLLKL